MEFERKATQCTVGIMNWKYVVLKHTIRCCLYQLKNFVKNESDKDERIEKYWKQKKKHEIGFLYDDRGVVSLLYRFHWNAIFIVWYLCTVYK